MNQINFAYVRSHLKFASVIWFPFYKLYINKIETIQNTLKYLCYTSFVRFNKYAEVASYFKIVSLGVRRHHRGALFLHKIINKNIQLPEIRLNQIQLNVPAQHGIVSYSK